jgi:diguanylate cyclase
MAVLAALVAAHQGLGLGGRKADRLFDDWISDGLLWCAAAVSIVGALRATRSRAAWLLVGFALACWATGDTIWSLRSDALPASATSISDVFWLAWYPLIIASLALLVRDRVPGFELHRWIDGVAVMLLVATPWVALFLEPVTKDSSASTLAVVLGYAYPLGDAVIVGAVLGVFAVMGWRPGRTWLALGIALAAMGVADAISSVHALAHPHDRGLGSAAWIGAAVLVAYAAWQPHPGRLERREVTGWAAIALAIATQALAISIQTYAIFHEIPRSERILTVLVLIIATIQIVISRPRARPGSLTERDAPNPPAPVTTSHGPDALEGHNATARVNEPRDSRGRRPLDQAERSNASSD